MCSFALFVLVDVDGYEVPHFELFNTLSMVRDSANVGVGEFTAYPRGKHDYCQRLGVVTWGALSWAEVSLDTILLRSGDDHLPLRRYSEVSDAV